MDTEYSFYMYENTGVISTNLVPLHQLTRVLILKI